MPTCSQAFSWRKYEKKIITIGVRICCLGTPMEIEVMAKDIGQPLAELERVRMNTFPHSL